LNSKKHQIHYKCLKCKHDQRFGYGKKSKRV
jgi:RNase P subunit RPR2